MTKKVIVVGNPHVEHSVALSALRNVDKGIVFIDDVTTRKREDDLIHDSSFIDNVVSELKGVVSNLDGSENKIIIDTLPLDLIPERQQAQDILTGKEERRKRRKDLRKRKFKITSIK